MSRKKGAHKQGHSKGKQKLSKKEKKKLNHLKLMQQKQGKNKSVDDIATIANDDQNKKAA